MKAKNRDGASEIAGKHVTTIGAPYRIPGGHIVTRYRCNTCNWDEVRKFDIFCSGCGRRIVK